MSLVGFDIVVEIARSALLDLLKSTMEVAGDLANPPFEITVTLPGGVENAIVHVIVSDLLLDLNADDTATLTFLFSNSSLLSPVPGPTITTLSGKVVVNAPLALTVSDQPQLTFPSINLATATVSLNFTTDAKGKLSAGLAGTGVNVAQFTELATNSIQTLIQGIGSTPLGNGYSVVPGANGALVPLRFERLELHCIVADSTNQAVGLFGILFAANTDNGNASAKTSPAIASGHDTCVNISPQVFHTLVFCPAVSFQLGVPVAALPLSCGLNVFGVPTGEGTLTNLKDSFGAGRINIDGSAHKSGFCYEADATFHGELTMSASGATLTPTIQWDEPEIDVSIDWYCGPAGGVAIGLTALINVAITNAIVEAVATGLAEGAIESVIGAPPTQNIGISGVDFDAVTIASDRLTIHGNAIVPIPWPRTPTLTLVGSVTTSDTTQLSTGMYTGAIAPLCPSPKDFPYTEYAQQQVASYQAVPTLLGLPLTLKWFALYGAAQIQIPPDGGVIDFLAQTYYVTPLPAGTSTNQVVHVGCSLSGEVIQMTNTPAEGNYKFSLLAEATDPAGNVVKTYGVPVWFEGNAVQIGGGYQEWYAECMAKKGELLKKFSKHVNVELTPWVPVDYPAPDQLLNHFITLAASSHPNAAEALLESLLAHKSSTYRALEPSVAKAIGKSKIMK